MVCAALVTNAPGTPEKGPVLVRPPRSKTGDKVNYYDEHGIDLQRAYEIVCLMVGSDNQDTSRILVRTRTMHASGILASGALPHLGAGA
jgi:hypothetical protein